jgi:hypothetical protein
VLATTNKRSECSRLRKKPSSLLIIFHTLAAGDEELERKVEKKKTKNSERQTGVNFNYAVLMYAAMLYIK